MSMDSVKHPGIYYYRRSDGYKGIVRFKQVTNRGVYYYFDKWEDGRWCRNDNSGWADYNLVRLSIKHYRSL